VVAAPKPTGGSTKQNSSQNKSKSGNNNGGYSITNQGY
jgi:hypothetical protein